MTALTKEDGSLDISTATLFRQSVFGRRRSDGELGAESSQSVSPGCIVTPNIGIPEPRLTHLSISPPYLVDI